MIIDNYNITNPDADIKLLFLPVAHSILNPIEHMFVQIKSHVRMNNTSVKTMDMIKDSALEKINQQNENDAIAWKNTYNHTWK